MSRIVGGALAVALLAAGTVAAADPSYTLKAVSAEAPKELKDPIRQLLGNEALQVVDPKGAVYCEVWLRKELPAKATPQQVKNGLTYRELEETTVLGAIRFDQQGSDYRKQKIKPGVYTLRLGFQPSDGDHMGTAPFKEFALASPADQDTKPDLLEPKALQEMSAKSVVGNSSHPAVLLLFPNEKPGERAKLVKMESTHWVLNAKENVKAGDQKTAVGIGLTVVGASESA
jgi:hypothetical protein